MPRRLVFIATVDEAGPPRDGTTYVVVDTAWTPRPGGRDDLVPVRPTISAILGRHDLFDEALEHLDAWAQEVRLDELMLADGVAWWYRIRPFVWYALHEAILWCRVIGELERDRPAVELEVRGGRPLLVAAARAVAAARGTELIVAAASDRQPGLEGSSPRRAPEPSASPPTQARGPLHLPVRLLGRAHRVLGRLNPSSTGRATGRPDERLGILDERVRALAGRSGIVLSIAYPRVYQIIASGRTERSADPQLAPVLDRLAEQGLPLAVVGLELDHRRDADWSAIVADDRLLPASFLRARWGRPGDGTIDSSDIAARVAGISVPLSIDGVDLSASVVTAMARYLPGWLDGQRRLARQAERMIDEIRPGVLFLNHEGIRTPWLAAARRSGLRVVAVQHGVIYPTHPVYRHARLPTIPLPDVTCLFGPYERDVLLEHGGYLAAEVAVTGSPRPGQDGVVDSRPADLMAERATVRRELGVADGDRLLVVSTANMWIVRDAHVVDMVARTLGGPLPGVHVVFKQHPGETDEGPLPALLDGLAASGGYLVPPTSVVRDIDLYRLLRAADAHLGLHSTVLTDAVVAGTPNLISVGQAYGDLLGYVNAGVARPVRDAGDVLAALADPRPPDPGARAAFLARHLRDGDAVGRIVRLILAAEGAAPETST
jgi:hypothetical protein